MAKRGIVIGLTGLIGAGKSTAATTLAKLGALVLDADQIGHQVVEQSETLQKQLLGAFGSEILDGNGQIARKRLAARAFVNDDTKSTLNRLVHPHLLRALRKQVAAGRRTHDVVVIDAALLLYWDMDQEVDCTLVIHTGQEIRWRRMHARGITREDARARERAQSPFSEFRARADRVILNSGPVKDLKRKIKAFWREVVG